MKKLLTFGAIAAVLAIAGCAVTSDDADESTGNVSQAATGVGGGPNDGTDAGVDAGDPDTDPDPDLDDPTDCFPTAGVPGTPISCPAPRGRFDFKVAGFDSATNSLVGRVNGQSVLVKITPQTRFRRAPLAKFYPSDPVRPAAVLWNQQVQLDRRTHNANFNASLTQAASKSANFRMKVTPGTANLKAIRLIPSTP